MESHAPQIIHEISCIHEFVAIPIWYLQVVYLKMSLFSCKSRKCLGCGFSSMMLLVDKSVGGICHPFINIKSLYVYSYMG